MKKTTICWMLVPVFFFSGLLLANMDTDNKTVNIIGVFLMIPSLFCVYLVGYFRRKEAAEKKEAEKQRLYQQQYQERLEKDRIARELHQKQFQEVSRPSALLRPSSSQKGIDKNWIDEGEGFARCPKCNKKMTHDFARARGKCPECGYEYVI